MIYFIVESLTTANSDSTSLSGWSGYLPSSIPWLFSYVTLLQQRGSISFVLIRVAQGHWRESNNRRLVTSISSTRFFIRELWHQSSRKRVEPNCGVCTSTTHKLSCQLVSADEEFQLSIVTLHGLDGHWRKTWSTNSGDFWLRDFLPSAIPDARVLSYGYDSRTHDSTPVSQLFFSCFFTNMARHLLPVSRIWEKRQKSVRWQPTFLIHGLDID